MLLGIFWTCDIVRQSQRLVTSNPLRIQRQESNSASDPVYNQILESDSAPNPDKILLICLNRKSSQT